MSRSRVLLGLAALLPLALVAFAVVSALQPMVANAALQGHSGSAMTATSSVAHNAPVTNLPYATLTPKATGLQSSSGIVPPNGAQAQRLVSRPATAVPNVNPHPGYNNMGNWNCQRGGCNGSHPMGGNWDNQNHEGGHGSGWGGNGGGWHH